MRPSLITLIATAALMWVGCERASALNAKQLVPDPCALLTPSEVSALLGGPAVKKPLGHGECRWSFESADQTNWSLRASVKAKAFINKPDISVTKTEVTYNGRLVTGRPITEHVRIGHSNGLIAGDSEQISVLWMHADTLAVHVQLRVAGPRAPKATTKIGPMKQLAQMVDAALAAGSLRAR